MVREGAVASGDSGGSFGGIGSIPPAAIPPPMALTDLAIRDLQAAEKPFKASDSGELHLLVSPNGSRMWRLKDRFESKEKLLALGAYPIVTLAKAREKRDAAKARLADGIDPAKSGANRALRRWRSPATPFALSPRNISTSCGGRAGACHSGQGRMAAVLRLRRSRRAPNFGDCRGRGARRPSQGEAARQAGERPAAAIDGGLGLPLCHRHRARRERSDLRPARRAGGCQGEAPRGRLVFPSVLSTARSI